MRQAYYIKRDSRVLALAVLKQVIHAIERASVTTTSYDLVWTMLSKLNKFFFVLGNRVSIPETLLQTSSNRQDFIFWNVFTDAPQGQDKLVPMVSSIRTYEDAAVRKIRSYAQRVYSVDKFTYATAYSACMYLLAWSNLVYDDMGTACFGSRDHRDLTLSHYLWESTPTFFANDSQLFHSMLDFSWPIMLSDARWTIESRRDFRHEGFKMDSLAKFTANVVINMLQKAANEIELSI